MFVSIRKAKQHYGVSSSTLRRWADGGKVPSKRTVGGHRVFGIVGGGGEGATGEKEKIVYCRVSSCKQRDDLDRQVGHMADKYPEHTVVRDVGSGINFKRPGLLSILGRVLDGRVQEVVVANGTEGDGTEKSPEAVFVAFKTRCYPNAVQKDILAKMAGTARFLYNKAVETINSKSLPFETPEAYEKALEPLRKAHAASEEKRFREHLEKLTKHAAKEAERLKKWQETSSEEAPGSSKRKRAALKPFEPKPSPVFEPKGFEAPKCPWLNKYWMRDYLASGTGPLHAQHPWLKDVPKHTKEAAVIEAIEATKAALSNKKNGNIRSFELGFRRKKDLRWSLSLASNAASGRVFFKVKYKEFGALKVAEERGIREKYNHEITISRDTYGRYFLVTREKVAASAVGGDNQARERGGKRVVMAVDPGQRTRHAVYSTDGHCYKIGDGDSHSLMGLCKEVDRCVSILQRKHYLLNGVSYRRFKRTGVRRELFDSDTGHKKYKGTHVVPLLHQEIRALKRKVLRIRARVSNLKDEIDNQTVNFFCKNADVVLIPKFDAHNMVGKLQSKTARSLMNWRHGAFREKLVERGRRRGLQVLVVTEHYTTKTCGRCGNVRQVGGAKVYRCSNAACGVVVDRDFNGARNIFLRAIRQS